MTDSFREFFKGGGVYSHVSQNEDGQKINLE